MAHTDTDLRELLAARAAVVPDSLGGDSAVRRVTAVDRRVRVIRRRRAAAASLSVVVVLLVATGLSGLLRDSPDRSAPVPAYRQKVAGGLLPRYNGGDKATAYTAFQTDEKRATTFTFTPKSWDFSVAAACDKEMPTSQAVSIEINGKPYVSGNCSRGFTSVGSSIGEEQPPGAEFGMHLGEPATMGVNIVRSGNAIRTWTVGPEKLPAYRGAMGSYQVAVGIYTPMPVADYPFPPRPHQLLSLDDTAVNGSGGRLLGTVDARSVGPTGHGDVTTTLTRKGVEVDMYSVAPGAITVTVNGTVVGSAASWAWTGEGNTVGPLTPHDLRGLGIDVKAGDRITVGAAGARFTDPAWVAQVREGR
jgi:hypothetical protein